MTEPIMTEPITIVIAEDHPLFRKGLKDVLDGDPSFRIIGEAGDGETALALVRQRCPRIALLDIEMPKASGFAVAEAVRDDGLGTDIVMLTMHKGGHMLNRALELGVKGYLLKDSAVTEVAACLHMVASGRPYVSPELSGDLIARRSAEPAGELAGLKNLTPTERRVLQLIAAGRTTAEISQMLGNKPKTVENHRQHICRKLGLSGPQTLLRFALEHKGTLE